MVIHHGAWYCPEESGEEGTLDLHGCDNVLTIDIPSSKLSCGNVANSTLVRIRKYDDELGEIYVHRQPDRRNPEEGFRRFCTMDSQTPDKERPPLVAE